MAELQDLLQMEYDAYEHAGDEERDVIAKRIATLLRVNDRLSAVEVEAERVKLEDERERIKIDADVDIRVDELEQAKKAERDSIVLKILDVVGLIGKELISIKADRRNMHELMAFEKSPDGYNIMSTQSSKRFFLNGRKK